MSFGISWRMCSHIALFVTELWFDRNMDDSLRNDAHHLPCDEYHLSPCAFRPSSGRLPTISQKWNEILLMESVISRDAHLPSYLNSTARRRQAASTIGCASFTNCGQVFVLKCTDKVLTENSHQMHKMLCIKSLLCCLLFKWGLF